MPAPREFVDFVDKNADAFIKRLAEAVAIPRSDMYISLASVLHCSSVSGEPDKRNEVIKMVHWMDHQLKAVGLQTELKDLGTEKVGDKETIDSPLFFLR